MVNLYTLAQAFVNGSQQDEKTQVTHVDRWAEQPVYLEENHFEIAFAVNPGIPAEYGKVSVLQTVGQDNPAFQTTGTEIEIAYENCTGERLQANIDYW